MLMRSHGGPVLVVLHEKHGDVYQLARSPADVAERVFPLIFAERDNDGYYGREDDVEDPGDSPPRRVPVGEDNIYDEAWRRHERDHACKRRDFEDHRHFWKIVVAARAGDLHAACRVVAMRRDYQYEGYDLIPLEWPPGVTVASGSDVP